jgi:hypothetical protein
MYENLEQLKKEIKRMMIYVDMLEDEREELLNDIIERVGDYFEDYEDTIEGLKEELEEED